MIYAFDTYYFDQHARTVCLAFEDWAAEQESAVYTTELEVPSEYESGAFYKRELPCILDAISKIKMAPDALIIVDGFVSLDDEGKKGLGSYLFDSLEGKYPVIGIAKNGYAAFDSKRREVYRGASKKPLYLTAISANVDQITEEVKAMHGEYRIPTLLKRLDQLTRA